MKNGRLTTLVIVAIAISAILPVVSAYDTDATGNEITVYLTVTTGTTINQSPLAVTLDEFNMSSYGFGHVNVISGITAAHVMVKAHADVFGVDGNGKAKGLEMRSNGWIDEFWNIPDGTNGRYISYLIDNVFVNTTAPNVSVSNGSIINLFFFDYLTEATINFYNGSTEPNPIPPTFNVTAGSNHTFTISSAVPSFPAVTTNVPIYELVGSQAAPTGLTTDSNSQVTIAFPTAGTYWIMACQQNGGGGFGSNTAMAWAKIIVS